MERFRNAESRNLLAFVVACDPSIKKDLRTFLKSVVDIKHDRMHIKRQDNTYEEVPDPGAWTGLLKGGSKFGYSGMSLTRMRDGSWYLNGF